MPLDAVLPWTAAGSVFAAKRSKKTAGSEQHDVGDGEVQERDGHKKRGGTQNPREG